VPPAFYSRKAITVDDLIPEYDDRPLELVVEIRLTIYEMFDPGLKSLAEKLRVTAEEARADLARRFEIQIYEERRRYFRSQFDLDVGMD
jgi:hypothetical protein